MLSNYWLLPLRWQPNWLFESLTAFNFGWKDDDDDDDAVRLPFPYPWVAHFDQVNNRLFLWTWLFRFFHYIFYLAIWWGPFKLGLLNLWLFFTCATLKWKTGPENVLGFLVTEMPLVTRQPTWCKVDSMILTFWSFFLWKTDFYWQSFESQCALEPFLCLCRDCKTCCVCLHSELFLVSCALCLPFLALFAWALECVRFICVYFAFMNFHFFLLEPFTFFPTLD